MLAVSTWPNSWSVKLEHFGIDGKLSHLTELHMPALLWCRDLKKQNLQDKDPDHILQVLT